MTDHLDELAGAISDGAPVDWTRAEETGGDVESTQRLRALRDLAHIAEFNRSRQRAAPEAVAPDTPRWGELLLLARVGGGVHGEVWRAWEPRLQREVALKLWRPDAPGTTGAGGTLVTEARALARVRHPNVVTVYGIDTHDDRPGVWMEFLSGRTLAEVLETREALPPAEVVAIGRALCRALGAIHQAGLLHRDIKPANVVLEPGGRVVLTDFALGVPRFLADQEIARGSGTPMFMAPEQLAGGPASPRSDLYALGVTLWWALAGRAPFAARTVSALAEEARRGPSPGLRELRPDAPPALVQAIERAMAAEPAARFASAESLDVALAAAGAEAPAVHTGARGGRGFPYAIAAALVVLAGVAWWVLRPHARAGATAAAPTVVTRVVAPSHTTAVPAAYDVEATLLRRTRGRSVPLASGDRVALGDRLSLDFRATRPAWVYVLDEDERGQSFLLFPQPLFDRRNPMPADSAVMLPGTVGGQENGWTVTSRGGREHLLVVASPTPLDELEQELAKVPPARPGRPIAYAPVPSQTMERLRGVGGVSPVGAEEVRRAGTLEKVAALAGRERGVRGVWVRTVTLENR